MTTYFTVGFSKIAHIASKNNASLCGRHVHGGVHSREVEKGEFAICAECKRQATYTPGQSGMFLKRDGKTIEPKERKG